MPKLISRAGFDPPHTVSLFCGPEVTMRFAASALLGAGVPAGQIHLSMERNMKCGIGLCGHCQFGPDVVCKVARSWITPVSPTCFTVREI